MTDIPKLAGGVPVKSDRWYSVGIDDVHDGVQFLMCVLLLPVLLPLFVVGWLVGLLGKSTWRKAGR